MHFPSTVPHLSSIPTHPLGNPPHTVKLKVIGGFRAMGAPVPSASSALCGKPANYTGRIPSKSCGWLRQPEQLLFFNQIDQLLSSDRAYIWQSAYKKTETLAT